MDVIGVEIVGVFKNIIVVGVGVLYGLGFGDNVKAVIIVWGLVEIICLGVVFGVNLLIYSGLFGVGDLIVMGIFIYFCNWRVGDVFGCGEFLVDIEVNMGMVIEGILIIWAVYELV